MKFQFMREKQMTIKKLAAVLLGSIVAISSAQAALISSSIAYGAANAAAAETAFLDGSLSYETEDFNSFIIDSTSVLTGTQQEMYIRSQPSFSTIAGTFTVLENAKNDSGEVNPDNLMIESIATGEFGRDISKAADDFWLDSNDTRQVTWDLAGVNSNYDSLGFYLTDANDNGARLVLRYSNGTTEDIALNYSLPNGNVAYISIFSDTSISTASIVFDNNGDTDRNTNDGWAIDNVTVAKVPEPTALAIFALGLLGLVAARKRV
ncbi:MAG: hypothetical protein ACI97K_003002 [Glaciecola sp.]|jgi:hypothetical protein